METWWLWHQPRPDRWYVSKSFRYTAFEVVRKSDYDKLLQKYVEATTEIERMDLCEDNDD